MPTYLKLIIMLGEMIGLLIFSFIRCRKEFKAYKENKYNETCRSDLKISIIYYAICNSIILFIFIFAFPSYMFLSYSKLILLTIAVASSFLPSIFVTNYEEHRGICTIVFFLFLVGTVSTGVIAGFSFRAPEDFIHFKTCINEEKYTVTINPEINLTDESKIGHYLSDSGDIDNYIFFYQDSNSNWYKIDEHIEKENIKELSNDESTYVEKYVTKKTILNYELNESDDNYTTTELTVSYKIYYNPNELIEITD